MGSSLDSPGPLTKNIYDSALVTQVIAGHDPFDATTSALPVNIQPKKLLTKKTLKGIKLALPKEYLVKEMDDQTAKLIDKAVKKLQSLGAKVEEISLIDPHYSIGVYIIVQRSEVSSNLARYDGVRYGHSRKFFKHEAKNRAMLGTYTLSAGYYDQYYNKAQKVRTLITKEFNQVFKKYHAVIGPISPGPALKVGSSQDNPMFGEVVDMLAEPSSIAGLTGLSVPCGFVNNLPVALQITGPQFSEQEILNIGYIYQQNTDFQKFPSTEYD